MSIYLPIAEIPIDIFLLLGIGLVGGLLAGIFGIGGGFLVTPVLIFIGVPPSVAVATSANQIVASSVTGFLSHWHRRNVDIKMGIFLLMGGFVGAYVGILIFALLKALGQIDLAISLIYVIFLGSVGSLMFYESVHSLMRKISSEESKPERFSIVRFLKLDKLKRKLKTIKMPFVVNFPKSNLKISVLMPISIGLMAGIMVSLMGIGGGFVMIPAMIYLLKMPAQVVVGTSLFQIIFTTAMVTILHAVNTQSVDIVLASLLIIGGVLGAQLGTGIGMKIPAEKLRLFLALIILAVCIRLGANLFIEPEYLYSITSNR
jgi:hypothetical protein